MKLNLTFYFNKGTMQKGIEMVSDNVEETIKIE